MLSSPLDVSLKKKSPYTIPHWNKNCSSKLTKIWILHFSSVWLKEVFYFDNSIKILLLGANWFTYSFYYVYCHHSSCKGFVLQSSKDFFASSLWDLVCYCGEWCLSTIVILLDVLLNLKINVSVFICFFTFFKITCKAWSAGISVIFLSLSELKNQNHIKVMKLNLLIFSSTIEFSYIFSIGHFCNSLGRLLDFIFWAITELLQINLNFSFACLNFLSIKIYLFIYF